MTTTYDPHDAQTARLSSSRNGDPGDPVAGDDHRGPGCFDIAHHWIDGTTRFTVTVTNPDADGGTAQLAVVWPPGPDATTIVAQAIAATRTAGDITVTEQVSSGPAATFGPDDLMTTGDDYISASHRRLILRKP